MTILDEVILAIASLHKNQSVREAGDPAGIDVAIRIDVWNRAIDKAVKEVEAIQRERVSRKSAAHKRSKHG